MDKNRRNSMKRMTLAAVFILAAAALSAQGGGWASGGGAPSGPPGGAPGAEGGGMGGMGGMGMFFSQADLDAPVPTDIKDFTVKDFLTLVRKTDIKSSFYDTDMTATITMVSVSPERGTMTRKEMIYRRDKDDAFLMLTLEPESRKGQGMLRVDNNMWRYDPKSRKYTHTTLKDTYEDTTARNSDFRRNQRSIDYKVNSIESGTLGKYEVWIGEMGATSDEVPFPTIKMWIEKERQIVLKVEEYSVSKKLLRTAYYTNYVKIGNSYVPTVQIFQDGLIPEKRTQTTYTNISTMPVPDDVFTKNYLERMSQ